MRHYDLTRNYMGLMAHDMAIRSMIGPYEILHGLSPFVVHSPVAFLFLTHGYPVHLLPHCIWIILPPELTKNLGLIHHNTLIALSFNMALLNNSALSRVLKCLRDSPAFLELQLKSGIQVLPNCESSWRMLESSPMCLVKCAS
jgi:hypothetical protein